MKKGIKLIGFVVVVSLTIILLYFLERASEVSLPFGNNFLFMSILVILIWLFYIIYLWDVLENARKKKR